MEEPLVRGGEAPHRARIVVGGDYTPAGTAALLWAVAEAERTGSSVTVVHAFDAAERADLLLERRVDPHLTQARRDARYRTYSWVVEALAETGTSASVLVATPAGPVGDVLAEHAQDASLLVLGEPSGARHGGLPELLSRACACPVVTVSADGAPATVPA